jgi:hypothetical protein
VAAGCSGASSSISTVRRRRRWTSTGNNSRCWCRRMR